MGFPKRMSCIPHYSVTQSTFTAVQIHVLHPFMLLPPLPPLGTTDLFTVSIVFPFSECYVALIKQYMACSNFFHFSILKLICIYISSTSFHGLIAYLFLLQSNILFNEQTSILIVSPTKGQLGYFQFGAILDKDI